jgi:hypothetical protein
MKQLTVENLEKPYFISYRVDSDKVSVSASFGALNHSTASRSRRLIVDVRVGTFTKTQDPPDGGRRDARS